MSKPRADIGVFGGSGFYRFLDNVQEIKVDTPYGAPSDHIAIAEVHGKQVAFLPRHGRHHSIPPHKINFRANLWAMKDLGVTRIISPFAAGSLQAHIHPGDFVVVDQYVDRTHGRADTFYEGPIVTHVSPADPYCPTLRQIAVDVIREQGITCHERGTVVVIQGPRFSTKAESQWYTSMGWETISMTQYPEAYLARELAMCVVGISLITDYDSGLVMGGQVPPVTTREVMEVFQRNSERIKNVVLEMIRRIPDTRECPCPHVLDHARIEV